MSIIVFDSESEPHQDLFTLSERQKCLETCISNSNLFWDTQLFFVEKNLIF